VEVRDRSLLADIHLNELPMLRKLSSVNKESSYWVSGRSKRQRKPKSIFDPTELLPIDSTQKNAKTSKRNATKKKSTSTKQVEKKIAKTKKKKVKRSKKIAKRERKQAVTERKTKASKKKTTVAASKVSTRSSKTTMLQKLASRNKESSYWGSIDSESKTGGRGRMLRRRNPALELTGRKVCNGKTGEPSKTRPPAETPTVEIETVSTRKSAENMKKNASITSTSSTSPQRSLSILRRLSSVNKESSYWCAGGGNQRKRKRKSIFDPTAFESEVRGIRAGERQEKSTKIKREKTKKTTEREKVTRKISNAAADEAGVAATSSRPLPSSPLSRRNDGARLVTVEDTPILGRMTRPQQYHHHHHHHYRRQQQRGTRNRDGSIDHERSDRLKNLRYQPITHEWLNEYFINGRGWGQVLFVASDFKEETDGNFLWVSNATNADRNAVWGYVTLSEELTKSIEFYIGETPMFYRVLEAGTYG